MGNYISDVEKLFQAAEVAENTRAAVADVSGDTLLATKSSSNIVTVVSAFSGDSYVEIECKENESPACAVQRTLTGQLMCDQGNKICISVS